jgi:hypothetical protein
MSKKTLNETNLAALGPEKLAALLIEVSTGSADIKRRLRLELSHNLGAGELAHDIRKRLASLRKSNSFVGWRKRKALVKDLSTQVAMITDKIAPEDPTLAFDLLWAVLELAPSIYGRTDDSKGDVSAVFTAAMAHFADICPRAVLDPITLADRVWTALQDNDYGAWDDLVAVMAPALGNDGLTALKDHVEAYADSTDTAEDTDHDAVKFLRTLRGGDDYAALKKARFVKLCLQDIAACAGDTSAYIAQYSSQDLRQPGIAAEVAMLQLNEGDIETALNTLLTADQDARPSEQSAWDAAYIASLTALGRTDAAQDHRWDCFRETLDATHLREYLKRLPDFEDVAAEDQAKRHVSTFPDVMAALQFCLAWPDLLTASELIKSRQAEINGIHYDALNATAETLRSRYPLAAVLVWRAMITSVLRHGHTKRYAQAVEHMHDCTNIDLALTDYEGNLAHDDFLRHLRQHYDRKKTFWAAL